MYRLSLTGRHPQSTQGHNTTPFKFRGAPVYSMGKHHRNHYPSQAQISCPGRMPFTSGSVYPKPVAQQYPNQPYPSRPPGAKRNRRKRYRKAEPLIQKPFLHESFGLVANDRSIGIDPGHAWIGSSNNTRVGKVWRTPSENLLMTDLQLNLENENPHQGSSRQQGSSVDTHRPLCHGLPNPH